MYSHISELPKYLQEKVSARLYQLQETLPEQDDEIQTLFGFLFNDLMSEQEIEEDIDYGIFNALNSEKILCMKDMLEGAVGHFAKYILSEDYYNLFKAYLQIEEHCTVSLACQYVPAGGKRPLLHINAIVSALKNFLALDVSGLNDDDILNHCIQDENEENEESYLPTKIDTVLEWLTTKILSEDQEVISFITKELEDDNLRGIFITPIFKSGNCQLMRSLFESLLEMLDYIDDEDTPEDLVREFFEAHVSISAESMLFLLDRVEDDPELSEILVPQLHRLLCPNGEISTESVNDIFNLTAQCLRDPEFRKQLLDDEDPRKLYIALWAIGFFNADKLWYIANQMLKDENPQYTKAIISYYHNFWAKESLYVLQQRYRLQ